MALLRKIFLMVAFFSLTACGALAWETLYNAKDIPIPQTNVAMEKIEKAILDAGARHQWKMKKVEEGKIRGIFQIRIHTAKILVTYNKEKFNIEYADSVNLHYDPRDQRIHKNYNAWIKRLENEIQAQLRK